MFLKVFKKKEIWLLLLAIAAFSGLCLTLLNSIHRQQGNARVVNYMGIVRGATQKLIKEEMFGQHDQALLLRLDTIIDELSTGGTVNNLVALDDVHFQENMKMIKASWSGLKTQIYTVRQTPTDSALYKLYDLSQKYFELANETVGKAESYSEEQVLDTRKVLVVCYLGFVAFLLAGLIYFIYMETVRHNMNKLNTLAYFDERSALPNRAKCDEVCRGYEKNRPKEPLTVFMLDMNNLELVNKQFGHQAGDDIIRGFSRILLQWARKAHGFIGRYGGDEFLGVFAKLDEPKLAALCAQLTEAVQHYNAQQKEDLLQINFNYGYYTASLGRNAEMTMEQMVHEADLNMYEQRKQAQKTALANTAAMWVATGNEIKN